jgi:hypothetical protein
MSFLEHSRINTLIFLFNYEKFEITNMLKFKKLLPRTFHPANSRIIHQWFSVLFMNGKEFNPAVFDVLIQDFDDRDLHGTISELLGKPYLSLIKEN